MAVPRPVLIAVVGVALIGAVFVLMRGQSSNGTVAPAPTVTSTPAHPKATTRPAAPSAPATRHAAPAKAQAQPKPHAPAKPQPAPAAASPIQPVVDALASGRTVVILFSQSGSADDSSTRAAVATVQAMPGVSVFSSGLAQLSAYRPLLSGVAVSQLPAVVVARTGAKARLIEGFVDPGTLRQTVVDVHG